MKAECTNKAIDLITPQKLSELLAVKQSKALEVEKRKAIVSEKIPLSECDKLHPNQWVKLYGLTANQYEHINTCQVYQLEAMIGSIQRDWWDAFALELVDEKEQPMSVEEAFSRNRDQR